MSAVTGIRRPRPVITVVEARPLDEVGFRGTPGKSTAVTSSQDEVQLRPPPKRPGAPPSRPPSWRNSLPANSQQRAAPDGAPQPLQVPMPAPRTSLNPRPVSMTDRPTVDKSAANNSAEMNLINFDEDASGDVGSKVEPRLYPRVPKPMVDEEPVYAVVNKLRKTDMNQNLPAAVPLISSAPPPLPNRTVDAEDLRHSETVPRQPRPVSEMSALPTPLAFLNAGRSGGEPEPFPVLRKTVYSEPEVAEAKDDENTNSGVHGRNKFSQGVPVFPMAPGFALRKTPTDGSKADVPRKQRPVSMGPPTAAKPKPGIKPKPALKPKPATKPKPGSYSAPVTPSEPEIPEPVTKPETQPQAFRPQSMMALPVKESEEEIARQTRDQETSVGNIIHAMRAKLESSQTENSSGKPKPMKATYRPTIIRPQARKSPEDEDSGDKLPQDDTHNAIPTTQSPTTQSKPAQSGPARNRPTIIRACGPSQPSTMTTDESEPSEQNRDQFRENLNNRLGMAISMPNLAATKVLSGTDAHNWESHEESDNLTNDLLAADHGVEAGSQRSLRPPGSPVARQRVLPMPGPDELPPRYSPPPDYEEYSFGGSVQHLAGPELGKPPARPVAAPRGESSADVPKKNSQPPPRPVTGPAPARPQTGPMISKTQTGHANQQQAGPLPTKQPLGQAPMKTTGSRDRGPPPDLPSRPGPGHPLFHYVVNEPHGIAVYDYEATQADELSFKSGEVVLLLSQVDDDWLLGRCSDREGIFPTSFVDIVKPPTDKAVKMPVIQKHAASPVSKRSISGSGPRCVARFDYEGEEADDLTFQADEVIKLFERIGDEWYKGELNGTTGIFPASYVEVIEDLPMEKEVGSTETGNVVRALHDFSGEGVELSFVAGAQICVLSQVNGEWLFGELDGKQGSFPASFVDRIPSNLPKKEVLSPSTSSASAEPHNSQSQASNEAYCTALFGYASECSEDLEFQVGDRITLLEHIGSDWLKGKLNDKVGIFPTDFVKIIKDLDDLPPRPGQGEGESEGEGQTASNNTEVAKAVAKYPFSSDTETDLCFVTGEIIILTEKIDEDWYFGCIDNKKGMFPAAYVEILVPL